MDKDPSDPHIQGNSKLSKKPRNKGSTYSRLLPVVISLPIAAAVLILLVAIQRNYSFEFAFEFTNVFKLLVSGNASTTETDRAN